MNMVELSQTKPGFKIYTHIIGGDQEDKYVRVWVTLSCMWLAVTVSVTKLWHQRESEWEETKKKTYFKEEENPKKIFSE